MKQAKRKRSSRGPSKASLREIPEVDIATAKVRGNPYAAKILREGMEVQIGRGRPKKVLEVGETLPRSVRFPSVIWRRLEQRAKKEGLTLHAALRTAILDWLNDVA